jgi:tight adherence protein B
MNIGLFLKGAACLENSAGKGAAEQDYNVYCMTPGQRALYILCAAAMISAISFIFYKSILFSALLIPVSFLYPRIKRRELIKQQKKELNIQFKDMLYSLSSSLSAGKSIESAFREVRRDIEVLYPDREAYIIREVEHIIRKLDMNGTVEEALADFAARSHVEDIVSFSEVFGICKRSGGNLVEVIRNTTGIINDKVEIRQEIDTMLSERRFEQKVLSLLPPAMILLLSVTAADYMEPVFTTFEGRAAMSAAIVLFAAAYFISKRIMDVHL